MNLVVTDSSVEEACALIPSLSRFPDAAVDEILDLIKGTMIRIVQWDEKKFLGYKTGELWLQTSLMPRSGVVPLITAKQWRPSMKCFFQRDDHGMLHQRVTCDNAFWTLQHNLVTICIAFRTDKRHWAWSWTTNAHPRLLSSIFATSLAYNDLFFYHFFAKFRRNGGKVEMFPKWLELCYSALFNNCVPCGKITLVEELYCFTAYTIYHISVVQAKRKIDTSKKKVLCPNSDAKELVTIEPGAFIIEMGYLRRCRKRINIPQVNHLHLVGAGRL